MENRMETKLNKATDDEVQKKIPTMEKKMQMEEAEKSVQKIQEKTAQQSITELKQRLPESIVRRMEELPIFNGTDSPRWILRMQGYFEFNPVDDFATMMKIIGLCMSGKALAWFRCLQKWKNPPGSWDEFRHALYVRFEGGHTMYDWFFSLHQEGTVRHYCSQFLLISALLPEIPDCLLEAKFMNGLKTEIRSEVRKLQSKGIREIMKTARLMEDENNIALKLADVDISCNTMMKLNGMVNERSVVVKIACGETHNFISKKLAMELKLPLNYTGDHSVVLGCGKTIKVDGTYSGVVLHIQNLLVFEEYLPLEIGAGDNTEIILGMPWLVNLGQMEVNWKALTMKLKLGKDTITLQGDSSL